MGCVPSRSEDENNQAEKSIVIIDKPEEGNRTAAVSNPPASNNSNSSNDNPEVNMNPSAPQNPKVGQYLKNIPLLSRLTDQERAVLGAALVEQSFRDQQNIITQGEPGHGFYIIMKGSVVVVQKADTGEVSELARLNEGDYFGEAALINNCKRGASVVAVGPVVCFYLDRENFNRLIGANKLNLQFAKRQAVSAEKMTSKITSNKFSPSTPANAIKTKTPDTVNLINSAVKDNILFMHMDAEHRAQVIAEMFKVEVKVGTNVITQGELGDYFYVVESGEFTVHVNSKKVATRGKGTCFGELALMYNSPRAATVTASKDSVVWAIDRFSFRRVVTDLSDKKFGVYLGFLKRVELLAPLAEYERRKIAEALEEVSFRAGSYIFKQGEEGDTMYVVYNGEVKVVKSDNGGPAQEVMRCKAGDYFGERALLKSEPRAASCIAVTDVLLLRIDRNAFSLLLGPLEDIMSDKVRAYEDKKVIPKAAPKPRGYSPKQEDLKLLGTLGKGSFGHVKLVQDKNTGLTYALKCVSKAQIVQTGQQGHVMSEKRVMAQLDHPFLIKLFATYKDRDRLYFLQELCLGGELFSVLRERTLFDEDTARFFTASVVLAFEYMHDRNIIYRDLKPENLLLDKDGFLKVTDFGFAKDIGENGRTWTLCGTPDYLAPEIVAGKGHGKGVDWWTLGVFVYEMLASYPPFYDEDPMRTYAKIMQGNIVFPSHFSKDAVSLIKKLLQLNPTKRMGCSKEGAKEIKKHPWFKTLDWDALYEKRIKPPIVPKIKNNTDMSNFDRYPDDDVVDAYVDDGSGWDGEF